jgi:hypothetical protein
MQGHGGHLHQLLTERRRVGQATRRCADCRGLRSLVGPEDSRWRILRRADREHVGEGVLRGGGLIAALSQVRVGARRIGVGKGPRHFSLRAD